MVIVVMSVVMSSDSGDECDECDEFANEVTVVMSVLVSVVIVDDYCVSDQDTLRSVLTLTMCPDITD